MNVHHMDDEVSLLLSLVEAPDAGRGGAAYRELHGLVANKIHEVREG